MATEEININLNVTGDSDANKSLANTIASVKKLNKAEDDLAKSVANLTEAERKQIAELQKKAAADQMAAEKTQQQKQAIDKLAGGFGQLKQAVEKSLSTFGKLSKDFGVSSEAAATLTLGFERLQVIGAVVESVGAAVTGFRALSSMLALSSIQATVFGVAINLALWPLLLVAAAAAALVAVFVLFTKSSKQVRSEQMDLSNTLDDVSQAYRDVAKAATNLEKSAIIEITKDEIAALERRKLKQLEILQADFKFSKEELAILQSGDAAKIEQLKTSESFAAKLREEGAKDAIDQLTKTNTEQLKKQEENAKARLEITKAFVEAENNLILAQLATSANVGSKIAAVYVNAANTLNDQLFASSLETQKIIRNIIGGEAFAKGGAEFNKQAKAVAAAAEDAAKKAREIADSLSGEGFFGRIKELGDAKAKEYTTFAAKISTAIVKANDDALRLAVAQAAALRTLDAQLYAEQLRLNVNFSTRLAVSDKNFAAERQNIIESRDIDDTQRGKKLQLLETQRGNARLEILRAQADAEFAVFKQTNVNFISELQRKLQYLKDYDSLNLQAQIDNINKQAQKAQEGRDAESARLDKQLSENSISEEAYSEKSLQLKEQNIQAQVTLEQTLNAARAKFLQDTLKGIKDEGDAKAKFLQAELNGSNANMKVLESQIKEAERLDKARNKNGVSFAGITATQTLQNDILNASLVETNAIAAESYKLALLRLETDAKVSEETIAQLEARKTLTDAEKDQLAKAKADLQVNLKERETQWKLYGVTITNNVNETEDKITDNNEKAAKARFDLLKLYTEQSISVIQSIAGVYKSVTDLQDAQAQVQLDANAARLAIINETLAGIDATIADKDAKLQELQANQEKASGARSAAIQAQIDNETAARGRATEARNKELENQKRIEAENARLASEKAQRDKTNAKIQIAIDTAQAYAKLGLAIAQVLIDPVAAGFSAATFGASTAITVAAILGSGLAAIGSTIAASQAFQFEKGGVIPEYASGGVLKGASHKNGGIGMYSGNRKVGEVEGGEVVLTKNVSKSPALLNVASAVNVAAGGSSLGRTTYAASGGILPNFAGLSQISQPTIDFSTMPTPVVEVSEIDRVQKRVAVMESAASF